MRIVIFHDDVSSRLLNFLEYLIRENSIFNIQMELRSMRIIQVNLLIGVSIVFYPLLNSF